jgi:hypothetical protein
VKIRIKGNSVRYRLTQNEVKTLGETGYLAEETCFGPGDAQKFVYALEAKDGITYMQAAFNGRKITLYIPASAAKTWYGEERVGFENELEVAPGISLHLLLEKDFACLDNTHEDQSDNFPNPKAVCGDAETATKLLKDDNLHEKEINASTALDAEGFHDTL